MQQRKNDKYNMSGKLIAMQKQNVMVMIVMWTF
jgi:hypothetical protein